jgi:leader peptidase (prepilin peptidase)/N-methyltransferase
MIRISAILLSVLAGIVCGRLLRMGVSHWRPSPQGQTKRFRFPLVEFALGAIWGFLAWRLADFLDMLHAQLGLEFPYTNLEYTAGIMLLCLILVGIAMLDADHFGFSDFITLPGVAVGVLFYAITSQQMMWYFVSESTPVRDIAQRLLSVVAAGALVMVIHWGYWLLCHREILGWREAHLMAMLAAWLGLPGALLAFGIGVSIGIALLLAWHVLPKAWQYRDQWALPNIPVGALVCAGGIVSCLWGPQILAMYLRWSSLPKLAFRLP